MGFTFWLFMVIDLSMVGLFAAMYGGKYKYKEGMLLGVHIPPAGAETPEAEKIVSDYRRSSRRSYIWNAVAAAAISFFCFWHFSVFVLIWTLWLIEFCVLSQAVVYRAHRKMYDLKVEKQWFVGEAVQNILIDTKVTADSGRMVLSHWYHLPAFLLSLTVMFFRPQLQRAFGTGWECWMLPGLMWMMCLVCWGMHLWFAGKQNVVYSRDTEINLAINGYEKRTWSVMWIAVDYLSLLSFAAMLYPVVKKGWIDGTGLGLFVTVQILTAALVLAGVMGIKRRRAELLSDVEAPLLVDDDVYWKKGWYENPDDSRLFVPDRMNSMNMSMNMGRTAGKVITWGTIVGTSILLLFMCVMLLRMDFTKMRLDIRESTVNVIAGSYELSFEKDEIQGLELVDEIQEGHLSKTNGNATDEMLLGKFRSRQSGDCRLYIYKGYRPVLKIKLDEYTVYINSREDGEVQAWYEELKN